MTLLGGVIAMPTREEFTRALRLSAIATLFCLLWPVAALAQDLVTQTGSGSSLNIDLGTGAGLTERVVQLIGLITVLSLAPSIVTSAALARSRAVGKVGRPKITTPSPAPLRLSPGPSPPEAPSTRSARLSPLTSPAAMAPLLVSRSLALAP